MIAEQVIDYLKHGTVRGAVNMPSVSAELLEAIGALHHAWPEDRLFQGQVFGHVCAKWRSNYSGEVTSTM